LEDYTDEILEDEDDEKLSKGNDGSEASEEDKEQKIKPSKDRLKLPRVRLVEISLVGMALVLWAGAIVLFFHRWGKIRMLLPYQPDYKEMKRNNSVCANCSMTPHHQVRLQNYDLFSMDSRITI
jgi:cytoskeletal protein RodZ